MAGSNFLDNMKSKVTWENKTIYGVVMIILGIIVWGMTHNYLGVMDILIIMIPSILLVIPNESVKNSKVLGIILIILLVIVILFAIGNLMGVEDTVSYYYREYQYYYSSYIYDYESLYNSIMGDIIFVNIAQIVYAILNMISAFMLTIPTKKGNSKSIVSNSKKADNKKSNFCKECGAELDNNSKFCPSCGKEV
ncbi:MAG: zinc ribbon domain-containing protein [Methanobrevibacter ruminantium]|uniref:zinc ribbon domain-containing protein n=1 Tax=Methanobrevibacter ruminantium TaxID=83816 RepID=UPI0026EF0752|nr:zinc ribbon domain-containing protein [Methanobrevibacter ruminantium]MDD6048192.1 zinc ribbon domain-containing protein [Methanobrevibacter ruminantium]